VSGPLSYHVTTNDGIILRRHVDHLRVRYCTNDYELSDTSGEQDDWIIMSSSQSNSDSPPTVEPITSAPASVSVPPPPRRHSTRTRAPIEQYSPPR
jgi:hypothetical protein